MNRQQERLYFTLHGVVASGRGRWRQPSFLGGISRADANRSLQHSSPKWEDPPSEVTDPAGNLLIACLSGRHVRRQYMDLLKTRGVRKETIKAIRSLLEC